MDQHSKLYREGPWSRSIRGKEAFQEGSCQLHTVEKSSKMTSDKGLLILVTCKELRP